VTARINESFGTQLARTVDAVSVEVLAPADSTQRVAFLSSLENLEVAPGEAPARVIVNSRTGTVVIGNHVRVMPAAVTHGSMVVTITEDLLVSQPPPFADGPGAQTVVVPDSSITVEQPESRMFLLSRGVTLNDIVQAVNAVGAAPADLVAILEALKQAGALQAELIVI
jgi:flagellar P-ring protein precursor FlgI